MKEKKVGVGRTVLAAKLASCQTSWQGAWRRTQRVEFLRRQSIQSGCSGFLDEPAADPFGDLTRRGFGQFGGVLAVTSNPIPPSDRLSDEFDSMRRAAAFFQADADVGGKSGHVFDPSEVSVPNEDLTP